MSGKLNPWLMFRRCMVTGELLCNRVLPDGCSCVKPANHHGDCSNQWCSDPNGYFGVAGSLTLEDIDPPTHPTP